MRTLVIYGLNGYLQHENTHGLHKKKSHYSSDELNYLRKKEQGAGSRE